MTREQLIQIAKAGFPSRCQETINFEDTRMIQMSGVYRLYDKDCLFVFALPKETILSVAFDEGEFVQIETNHNRKFNHYAAIKEIERLGILKDE